MLYIFENFRNKKSKDKTKPENSEVSNDFPLLSSPNMACGSAGSGPSPLKLLSSASCSALWETLLAPGVQKKKKNAVLPTRKARILSQPTFSNLSVRDQLLGSEGMSLGKPLPALQIGCAMYISFDILDTTVIICLMPVFYARLSYIRARTMSDLLLAHLQSSCQIRQNQYMRG